MAWNDKLEIKPTSPNKKANSAIPFEKRFRNIRGEQLCLRVNGPLGERIRKEVQACTYPRTCPKCGIRTNDILSHALTLCPKVIKLRITLRLKLLLFNAHRIVSHTKLGCKITLYTLALGNRLFRRSLCEFLVAFGYYT